MDGLIIKDPWIGMVLDNLKSWEIRGRRTWKRGTVYLIRSGSGCIVGKTDIVDCVALTEESFEGNKEKHRIEGAYGSLPYNFPWAWVFKNSIRFQEPIPYRHPQGAVVWVKDCERKIWINRKDIMVNVGSGKINGKGRGGRKNGGTDAFKSVQRDRRAGSGSGMGRN